MEFDTSYSAYKIRLFRVYVRMARKMEAQPSTMATPMPQKLYTLCSSMLFMFIPKMPATMAPTAAEKLPMDKVSSSRLTSNRRALRETPMDSSRSRAPEQRHASGKG